jgi:hypothetical protein
MRGTLKGLPFSTLSGSLTLKELRSDPACLPTHTLSILACAAPDASFLVGRPYQGRSRCLLSEPSAYTIHPPATGSLSDPSPPGSRPSGPPGSGLSARLGSTLPGRLCRTDRRTEAYGLLCDSDCFVTGQCADHRRFAANCARLPLVAFHLRRSGDANPPARTAWPSPGCSLPNTHPTKAVTVVALDIV